MDGSDLEKRLHALTPDQRVRLAARLGLPVPLRLVGFVVLEGGTDGSAVQNDLRQRLPAHMIPATLRAVEALPRLGNGKVDSGALLRAAETSAEPIKEASEAPANEVEDTLLGIWKEVLGLEELGVGDDFYEMGGDSVSTIHILARARREGLDFDPAALVEHPTVASLARVTARLSDGAPASRPPPAESSDLDASGIDEATLDELFGGEDSQL